MKRFGIEKTNFGLVFYHYEYSDTGTLISSNPFGSICWNKISRNCSYFRIRKFIHLLNGFVFKPEIGKYSVWIFIGSLVTGRIGFCRQYGILITEKDIGLHKLDMRIRRKSERDSFR